MHVERKRIETGQRKNAQYLHVTSLCVFSVRLYDMTTQQCFVSSDARDQHAGQCAANARVASFQCPPGTLYLVIMACYQCQN